MKTPNDTSAPIPWPHPGEYISEMLEAYTLTAAELSRKVRLPSSRLTEIIKGRRGITADTAIRLATAFGTTPNYWLNLQNNYDLRQAEEQLAHSGEQLRPLAI